MVFTIPFYLSLVDSVADLLAKVLKQIEESVVSFFIIFLSCSKMVHIYSVVSAYSFAFVLPLRTG